MKDKTFSFSNSPNAMLQFIDCPPFFSQHSFQTHYITTQSIAGHPDQSQVDTQALEEKGENGELDANTAWEAARNKLVAGMSVAAFDRSGNQIVINVVCKNKGMNGGGH